MVLLLTRLLRCLSVDMIPLLMQKGYKANGWLGLLLGTRLYYPFYSAESDDEAAFENRMDKLVVEIGDRGMRKQPNVPQAPSTPGSPAAPAPAPAPGSAPPSPQPSLSLTPEHTTSKPRPRAQRVRQVSYGSKVHFESPRPDSSTTDLHDEPAADHTQSGTAIQDLETKLEQQQGELERQRTAVQAMESKLQQLTALTAPHAVVSTQQVAGLTRRLQALHATRLLSDRELHAVEDCVADLLEAKASFDVLGRAVGRAVSAEVASSHRAVAKAHTLMLLSEGLPDDAMFARQCRRKFA